MRFVLILETLIAALATTADAQVKIYKLEAGHYMVQGDGIVTCQIVPPDVPTPPVVPPVVPPVSDLTKAVVAAVGKIPANAERHEQAMKLTAVLQLVRDKVADGTLPHTSAGQAVDLLAKAALGKTKAEDWKTLLGMLDASQLGSLLVKAGGAYENWSSVISLVESELSKQSEKAGVVNVLTTVSTAVLSTVPSSDEAVATLQSGGPLKDNGAFKALAKTYGFDWDVFLKFLMELLMVLLPLIVT